MVPNWLEELQRQVAGAFACPDCLNITARFCSDDVAHWELAVSPALHEGGGVNEAARLMFDVLALSKLLDKTHVIAVDSGCSHDTPEVRLLGLHQGDRVAVRVFLARPPGAS